MVTEVWVETLGTLQRDVMSWRKGVMSQGMLTDSTTGKGKKLASGKECGPADTLILAQVDPHWTSNLQDCWIINLCCFKPISLWPFLTAVTDND